MQPANFTACARWAEAPWLEADCPGEAVLDLLEPHPARASAQPAATAQHLVLPDTT
jgi:hypothetical protein